MLVSSKELKRTDLRVFSYPTPSLQHLDFGINNFVDLNVEDSSGELRVIRCWKRDGQYEKPVLSKGWLQFVTDYNLRVGDKVVLLREDDHHHGSHSSGLKQGGKSSCLARLLGMTCLELTS